MISAQDIQRYHRDGFIVVENVFPESTINDLRSEVDRFVEEARGVSAHTELYDLEDGHSADEPRVRRLKDPDRHSDVFANMVAHPTVIEILDQLWDGHGVRFDQSKLNLKAAGFGSPVEWHQDWAFYPHTNDDLAAVGFMIDDVTLNNGPMMVVPGSHKGPVFDHHANGYFCGGIDVAREKPDLSNAVPLTGKAGSITIHHVRAVHGSEPNRSGDPRRFLLHQYCAVDAWPLAKPTSFEELSAGVLTDGDVLKPRLTDVPVRMPFPQALNQGSIYENQRELGTTYFS